jgi:hypothetical protein
LQNSDIAPANVGIEFNYAANPSVMQRTIDEAKREQIQCAAGLP